MYIIKQRERNMKSDIEIAQSAKLVPIEKIAKKIGYKNDEIEMYGKYISKVKASNKQIKGKLILVTAMNPTPFGEGKTTIAIGLADALNSIKCKTALALREPSLGPVFGIKGGACGGGYSQVLPMEEINLHFTGDFHAITSANNLLSAMIDNHIFQGNDLKIKEVIFSRCLDVNDRALRRVTIKQSEEIQRNENFTITAASEIMAILALSKSFEDLKKRLGNILIAYDENGNKVFARDIKAQEAMAILLKQAVNPNLVQTIYGTPAYIHCGPFANIAHGCNSIIATREALSHADYVVTESGFGSELGGEKFLDIKCRELGVAPEAVVIVSTIRGIKHNGDGDIGRGFVNVERHIKNMLRFGMKVVVAINKFPTDSQEDIERVIGLCKEYGVTCETSTAFSDGPKGAVSLAKAVLASMSKTEIKFAYDLGEDIKTKIEKIAKYIYGATNVKYSSEAEEKLNKIENKNQYVCIAKTQYSFSHDSKMLGAPSGYTFEVSDVIEKTGSNFIVVLAGKMLLMPGLPKTPNAEKMTIDIETLEVKGLM